MERKDRRTAVPPVGATSLLTVFAVLCLTVFALLTLSDVRSDARLAETSLENIRAYYTADVKAQEILARLRSGETVEGVEEARYTATTPNGAWRHDTVYQYAVPISDTLELQVQVTVEGQDYQVLRWQSIPTTPWQEESNLQLWTPGSQ